MAQRLSDAQETAWSAPEGGSQSGSPSTQVLPGPTGYSSLVMCQLPTPPVGFCEKAIVRCRPPTATQSESVGHEIPEIPNCTGRFSEFRSGGSCRSVHCAAPAGAATTTIVKRAIVAQEAISLGTRPPLTVRSLRLPGRDSFLRGFPRVAPV